MFQYSDPQIDRNSVQDIFSGDLLSSIHLRGLYTPTLCLRNMIQILKAPCSKRKMWRQTRLATDTLNHCHQQPVKPNPKPVGFGSLTENPTVIV